MTLLDWAREGLVIAVCAVVGLTGLGLMAWFAAWLRSRPGR